MGCDSNVTGGPEAEAALSDSEHWLIDGNVEGGP